MKLNIQIFTNPKGGFTAICLNLPGCSIRAESKELARKKLEEAIRGYLAAMNNFVPENLAAKVVEV